jgi:general secretion pathway protein D
MDSRRSFGLRIGCAGAIGQILWISILVLTLRPILAGQNTPSVAAGPSVALSTSQPFDLESPVEQASFDLRRPDLRALYDEIARNFQIQLLYDRDLGEVPITANFRLQHASLQEALNAAASISRTFVAPVDSRTGIVAADTPDKRSEYERQTLGSFHLDDQITPQQLTEISNALRTIVDLRRVTQDTRTNWITVLGRTHQVDVARQFVQTLDRPVGEVLLEIEVWELDLDRARELGLSAPQPFLLRFPGRSPDNPTVPLFRWGEVATIYEAQIPGLTAFLNSTDGLARFHQVLRLRATDGQEARLLLGERIPVVIGDVDPVLSEDDDPASSAGFIPNVEYQDVGVIVHATPRFHSGGEITLELDIAQRRVKSAGEEGRPVFANRQLASQFRIGNDEAYLLGGLISRDDGRNVAGYPWLVRIPIIGWLFGNRTRQRTETELLVLVRPVILRAAAAEQFASRAIFFGKELIGLPAPAAVPPPQQPPPPGAQPVTPGVPEQPGTAPVPGQPQQPGTLPFPGALPPGFPFPRGVPPGVGVQPGDALEEPPDLDQLPQEESIDPDSL